MWLWRFYYCIGIFDILTAAARLGGTQAPPPQPLRAARHFVSLVHCSFRAQLTSLPCMYHLSQAHTYNMKDIPMSVDCGWRSRLCPFKAYLQITYASLSEKCKDSLGIHMNTRTVLTFLSKVVRIVFCAVFFSPPLTPGFLPKWSLAFPDKL